ncbi:MAG: PilZ domain-containing protein [Deltaproteobacteria bacterium]|nr:PilZ domain-containing protein [Deltaproteobacteria bacterium]
MIEKRKFKRIPVGFQVKYTIGGVSGVAQAIDVSSGGIFINIKETPNVGDKVYLSFILPGTTAREQIKIIGEITRIAKEDEEKKSGIGILFVAVPSAAKKTLEEYINFVDQLESTGIISNFKGNSIIKLE